MTAVIYARYSSDNQREESIEGQIRECTAYAEKNGITVIKHYIDRALSAKTDNRPDFQQDVYKRPIHMWYIISIKLKVKPIMESRSGFGSIHVFRKGHQ